jgi:group I intron endonuclease
MRRKDTSGIYKITSPSGRIYIGRSYRINERWRRYKRMELKGQSRLAASFIKHGVSCHVFEVIHELPNDVEKDVIEQYEVFYEQLYKNAGFVLLNIAPTGKGIGRLSAYQSRAVGVAHKGVSTWTKGKFGALHNRSVSVICNGHVYGSISEAHRITGIPISNIHYSLRRNKALKTGHYFQLQSI